MPTLTTTADLEAQLDHLRAAPTDNGTLAMVYAAEVLGVVRSGCKETAAWSGGGRGPGGPARLTTAARLPGFFRTPQRRLSVLPDSPGNVRVMTNDPYGSDEPDNRHEWGQEPPSPPATWSPYGYAAQPEDGRSTLGQDVGAPVLPPDRRPRSGLRGKGLAATVVAASLLLGGAAGVGGAAVWTSTHDDVQSSPVLTQTGGSTAQTAVTGSIEKVAQSVLPSVVMINVSGSTGRARAPGSSSAGTARS